jgi:hypothetical protein
MSRFGASLAVMFSRRFRLRTPELSDGLTRHMKAGSTSLKRHPDIIFPGLGDWKRAAIDHEF